MPSDTTRTMITGKDCTSCGVCCLVDKDEKDYVYVSQEDYERLPEHYRREVVPFGIESAFNTDSGFLKTRRLTTIPNDMRACVAWRGTPGVKARCLIYEKRPDTCVRFQPGSDQCLAARRRFGLEVTT